MNIKELHKKVAQNRIEQLDMVLKDGETLSFHPDNETQGIETLLLLVSSEELNGGFAAGFSTEQSLPLAVRSLLNYYVDTVGRADALDFFMEYLQRLDVMPIQVPEREAHRIMEKLAPKGGRRQ